MDYLGWKMCREKQAARSESMGFPLETTVLEDIWGFPARHGGTPQNRWMLHGKSRSTISMMTGGSPMTSETPIA